MGYLPAVSGGEPGRKVVALLLVVSPSPCFLLVLATGRWSGGWLQISDYLRNRGAALDLPRNLSSV